MKPNLLIAVIAALFCTAAFAQNRIAYITPSGQLATVSPDGSEERTLSAEGRVYQFPAWSPDGTMLAAIGAGPQGGGVYTTTDAEDAEITPRYESERETPIYLYWAPDSEQIAFLANHTEGLALEIAAAQGGLENDSVRRVTTGNPIYWQWSEDSAQVFVHRTVFGGESEGQVGFASARAGAGADSDLELDPLEEVAATGFFNVPSLSTGERFRAYAERVGGRDRVVLEAQSRSTQETRREVPYEGVAAFSWSPASDQLALMTPQVASPHPYGPLRLLDAQSGELTTLFGGTALAFFWSPDGRYLAYLTPAGDGGTQVAELGRMQTVQQVQNAPLLLELGVVDTETERSRTLTTFSPTPLFLGQFLPFFDQYALSHSLWAPDSSALVLPMLGEGGSTQVVVVPLLGEPRAITEGEMPFWSR